MRIALILAMGFVLMGCSKDPLGNAFRKATSLGSSSSSSNIAAKVDCQKVQGAADASVAYLVNSLAASNMSLTAAQQTQFRNTLVQAVAPQCVTP